MLEDTIDAVRCRLGAQLLALPGVYIEQVDIIRCEDRKTGMALGHTSDGHAIAAVFDLSAAFDSRAFKARCWSTP